MKYKNILIIAIIFCFLLLVFGMNQVKTNEIQKSIPVFSELAIFLDKEKTNIIPSKDSGYILDTTESSCNGATISWDNDSWSPIIANIGNITERLNCQLYFTTSLWRQWKNIGQIENDYATLHEFLSDTSSMESMFQNEDATNFLISNPALISEIKADPSYMDETNITEGTNTDVRSELVKIIINSTILTNEQKYNNGLPCYIFYNGTSLQTFSNKRINVFLNTIQPTYSNSIGTSVSLYLRTQPNNCTGQSYLTTIDLTNYSYSNVYYKSVINNATYSPRATIGFGNVLNNQGVAIKDGDPSSYHLVHAKNKSITEWGYENINEVTGNVYAGIHLSVCMDGPETAYASNLYVYEWYLF